MFKTILRFIGLKVIEIMAVVLAYIILVALGAGIMMLVGDYPTNANDLWLLCPFVALLAMLITILVGASLYAWISWNWKKAKGE